MNFIMIKMFVDSSETLASKKELACKFWQN